MGIMCITDRLNKLYPNRHNDDSPVVIDDYERKKQMRFTDLYPPNVIKQARQRLLVCNSCEMKTITPLFGMTCGKFGADVPGKACGCILKIKAYLPMFDCPQNKWK